MIIHNPILTGSFTVNGTDVASITSSAASITAINSYTASQNILNGTYATTGSNTFKNPQTINSNLIVTGSITAATLVVQTITSSVVYSSGSNVFGNNIANTQTFTGSVSMNPGGLFVSSSGLVGIGTSTPSYTLDVSGTGRFTGIATATIFDSTSNAFRLNGNNALSLVTLNSQSVVKINAAGFWGVQLVGANDKGILIDNTGNVGIGTTSPNYALTISGNTDAKSGLRIVNTDSGQTSAARWIVEQYDGKNVQFYVYGGGATFNYTTSGIGFYDGTNSTTNMQISTTNGVLIGKTALDTTTRGVWIRSSGGSPSWSSFSNDSDTVVIMNRNTSTGTILEFKYAGSVVGSISYNGSTTVLNPTSDKRLKENIVDASSGLAKLSKVKIRAYDWKQSGMHTDFGIIAQEIYESAPECVTVGNDELDENGNLKNPWCAQPYVLVSAAVKAIQELNEIVQELQSQITELKNK